MPACRLASASMFLLQSWTPRFREAPPLERPALALSPKGPLGGHRDSSTVDVLDSARSSGMACRHPRGPLWPQRGERCTLAPHSPKTSFMCRLGHTPRHSEGPLHSKGGEVTEPTPPSPRAAHRPHFQRTRTTKTPRRPPSPLPRSPCSHPALASNTRSRSSRSRRATAGNRRTMRVLVVDARDPIASSKTMERPPFRSLRDTDDEALADLHRHLEQQRLQR